jgi:dTDP-4-dehydrorhamnose 3,5-epimerase
VNVQPGKLRDVLLLAPRVFGDDRGFFFEAYNRDVLAKAGITGEFVQDNVSSSKKHVLRGLHYQIPKPQGKLVRVLSGEIFDVVVDLRRDSSTFGKSESVILSGENKLAIWVPVGFAHGFVVTSENALVHYKTTDFWFPQGEKCLRWDDPALGIAWPLGSASPLLSPKDRQGKLLAESEVFE